MVGQGCQSQSHGGGSTLRPVSFREGSLGEAPPAEVSLRGGTSHNRRTCPCAKTLALLAMGSGQCLQEAF